MHSIVAREHMAQYCSFASAGPSHWNGASPPAFFSTLPLLFSKPAHCDATLNGSPIRDALQVLMSLYNKRHTHTVILTYKQSYIQFVCYKYIHVRTRSIYVNAP